MKQFVGITGLGSEHFDESITGIGRWLEKLRTAVHPDKVADWSPGTTGSHLCLAFTNRLFTPVEDVTDDDQLAMPKDWDPTGVLARTTKGEVVYTAENVVQYVVMTRSDDNELYVIFRRLRFALNITLVHPRGSRPPPFSAVTL